jgi:hyaluronan synthase/N-acetylglucosaminyltransferase
MAKWLLQQERWSKSHYRETWWLLANHVRLNPMVAYQMAVQLVLPLLLLIGLISLSFHAAPYAFVTYGATIALAAFARGGYAYYVTKDPFFWLAPVYGALHIALVLPIRLCSIFTLWKNDWGTR